MAGALTAAIAAAFSGVTADPYFEYTTLLLPGSGTNGAQNNTFLDGSTNNFTITRNGNTTQGTFSPFSQTGWGNYFDGSGDYLSVPDNAAFDLGSGDFSIECWAYMTGAAQQFFVAQWASPQRSWVFLLKNSGTTLSFSYSTTGSNEVGIDGTITAQSGRWAHFAAVRNGNTVATYMNGVQVATGSVTGVTLFNASSAIEIGRNAEATTTWNFTGYMSNLRIVKGTAVYTSAFTPPTAPLTAISGTSLLTCQSNRFIDNSTNNFTITRNGDTSVVAFSPFNPTASWSAATYGGSGYFDGNTDYLATPSNSALAVGAGDFCIETWIYWGTSSVNDVIYSNVLNSGGGDAQIEIYINSSNKVVCGGWNTNFLVGSTNVTSNAWTHIAVCRSGTTMSLFLNGSRDATTTTSNNFSSTNAFNVGRQASGAYDFLGYISNLRVVKGSAVYDPTQTTLTVPTAPLTAITNTSLLLNFTNAGIYDATSKNDLETVGNAQISTTQSKWGGSSMSFDGTGDYLVEPNNINYDFGSGDFTIEFWMYSSQSAAGAGIVAKRSGGGAGNTNWMINCATGAINFYASDGTTYQINALGGGTVNNSAWHHVAVTRSGSSFRVFVDGTQVGSTGTWSGTIASTSRSFYVGVDDTFNVNYYAGYIQDLRITKGYARYTANFTAPTASFPTL